MTDPSSQQVPPPVPPPAPPVPPTPSGTGSGSGWDGGSTPRRGGRGGGGVTAGLILVFIGVALLLSRVVPGVSLWALWPLFIIVPGVVQCFTPGHDGWGIHRFFDGLTTIAIGLIFLGNTTGYLSWSVWWEVLMLWPVLLITAGLGILGKALNQNWIRALSSVVVLLALAYAVASSSAGVRIPYVQVGGGDPFAFEQSVAGATSGDLTIVAGVGTVDVASQTGSNVAIEGTSPFGDPALKSATSGGVARVDFVLTDQQTFVTIPGAPTARVNARVGDALPWKLTMDTGVATLDADLRDLDVSELTLKTGVSSSDVRLGAPVDSGSTVRVTSGVATTDIHVPRDVPARIESDSGLTAHVISGGFESQGDGVWETDDYQSAAAAGKPVWLIRTESGLGSISVDTY